MRVSRWLRVWLVVLIAGCGASAQTIPATQGTVLTGEKVQLPDVLKGKAGVLVLGFSQASREQVTEWGKRLAGEYRGSATVVYYEMPVLESVPRLLRGWVTNKMAETVPDRAKNNFLPVTEHEKEWKAAAGYKRPDDAYVLVVDGAGVVWWKRQGSATDATFAEVRRRVAELTAAK